jgi:hypothetical protein
MRDPTRKRQKEWSSATLMCIVDRDQLHLSVPSELCAWRSAPEQQIAIQCQGPAAAKARHITLGRRPWRASNPTTSYLAAQTGQWNKVAIDLDIMVALIEQSVPILHPSPDCRRRFVRASLPRNRG